VDGWHGKTAVATAFALISVTGACGSPTGPSTTVANPPPVITETRTSSPRVEAGEEVELTVFLKDNETPLDQLTYTWSVSPPGGTFSGTGRSVRWRAPKLQKTPHVYTLLVTVTEPYTVGRLRQENRVSSSAIVHYNDSASEVNGLAIQFYNDFGTHSVSAVQCVRNFSDSCEGKRWEREDIQRNRDRTDYRIVSSTLSSTPEIEFDSTLGSGTFLQPCTFEDISLTTGKRQRVSGDCLLTTVYEDWRWWLCESYFLYDVTTFESLRHRVPGRVISLP
jgi:hypothetical protein